MKKTIVLLISLTMIFAGIPAVASAADAAASGSTSTTSKSGSTSAASASVTAAAYQGDSLKSGAAKASSYGTMDTDSGDYAYKNPALTVPESYGEDPEEETLPVRYDLRDEGRSTSVKDQADNSFCWAFSTLASLESNLITKGIADSSIDLSEAHLANFLITGQSTAAVSKYAGKDLCFSVAGATNFYSAAATLARGFGAVNEYEMPYSCIAYSDPDEKYLSQEVMTRCRYELQDAIYIGANTTPEGYDEAAFAAVKKLIMENGAVASRVAFPDLDDWVTVFGSKKPNELKTYYSTEAGPNHAVTIIGWDDEFNDFDSENKPAGPGAWIIKDSYGEEFHGDGYFYLSYYSPSPGQYVSFTGQKASGRQIYQYDGVGLGDGMLYKAGKVTGSNTYTARTDILLDQMMTFAPEAGCSVNIRIYAAKNGTSPTSGVKLYDKTFQKDNMGYSRTDLGTKVGIAKGAKFSVLVTTRTSSGKYFVPFELHNIDDPLSSPAIVKSGQTDIYVNSAWKKVGKATIMKDSWGDRMRLHNALIKVFGTKSGTNAQTISAKTTRQMKKGKTIKLNAKRTKGAGKLIYQTSNVSRATVSTTGVVKAKTKGTVKITIYALPTAKYKSAKKVVTVKIK